MGCICSGGGYPRLCGKKIEYVIVFKNICTKEKQVNCKPRQQTCANCRHFRNSPEFLESVFKGLTALSSAYGSVRSDDGICLLNDLYLAANRGCDQFEPHPDGHI